jgi:hypothetical protein
MKKSSMITLIGTLVLGLALPAVAQYEVQGQKKEEAARGGVGVSWYMPKGELKESHDSGYGASVIFSYPASDHLDLTGTTAWSKYLVNDQPGNTALGTEDFSAWEFTLGPRLRFSIVYVGIEGGYFTTFDEWALVPNAGVRWKIFDLGYRMKMGDNTEVHSIRAGVFF